MSKLSEAVDRMNNAAHGLRQYIQHQCDYHLVDTPDGDVCTCRMREAVDEANEALFQLRVLARMEEIR